MECADVCFVCNYSQAVIWFLARWVDTYLMPVDASKGQLRPSGHDEELNQVFQSSKKILMNFAGQNKQGELILDIIVRTSITTLASFPGENELHVSSSTSLFFFFLLISITSYFHVKGTSSKRHCIIHFQSLGH